MVTDLDASQAFTAFCGVFTTALRSTVTNWWS